MLSTSVQLSHCKEVKPHPSPSSHGYYSDDLPALPHPFYIRSFQG